jgi:DNA-binding protein H-NS
MNSNSYAKIMSQIEDLEKLAAKARKAELTSVIKEVKKQIKTYGLTAADLGLLGSARSEQKGTQSVTKTKGSIKKARKLAQRGPAPVRFRGPNGETWSGRGKQPRWLVAALAGGSSIESYKVHG